VEVQERSRTTRTRWVIGHKDDQNFVVNTHSLHNHKLVIDALPENLRPASLALVSDRIAHHREAAEKVRAQAVNSKKTADIPESDMSKRRKVVVSKKAAEKVNVGAAEGTAVGESGGSEIDVSEGEASSSIRREKLAAGENSKGKGKRGAGNGAQPSGSGPPKGDRVSMLAGPSRERQNRDTTTPPPSIFHNFAAEDFHTTGSIPHKRRHDQANGP
jgi:hypothetical protein